MFDRIAAKQNGKASLKGNWARVGGLFLLISFVLVVISFVPYVSWIASVILSGPIALTYVIISMKVSRNEDVKIEDSVEGFKDFGRSVGMFWWVYLWTFLWTLLFVIPGIIASYRYRLAYYILMENPTMTVREALNESKRLMDGHKWEMFVFDLSFMGWGILASLTLGIGYFWLAPYMQVANANVYKQIAGVN